MKDEERILMLLQLIRINGDVKHLQKMGWSYVQIYNKLDEFMCTGLIQQDNDFIRLTKKGEHAFHYLSKILKQRGLYKFFKPSYDDKIVKINKNDIYIPEIIKFHREDWE